MLRAVTAISLVAALSACVTTTPTGRAVSLGGGDILLRAPSGYCVDSQTSRPADDFAVLAPCATLGTDAPAPSVVGLVTVQAGDAGSGSIAADEASLRDFLVTNAGKSLLSQSGTAADIRILSTQAFDDQVMVHFSDQGEPLVKGLQDEEWRAFRDVDGRLVTISVRGLAAAPLQDGPGASLLKEVIAGVTSTDAEPAS